MARPTNKGLVSKQNLVNIGNAIRTKTGETAPIALTDMPSKILALGTADNPLIATSDSEMATYLADTDKSGMFVQFNGTSTTYVNGEVYRILDSGDTTQYIPTSDIKVEQEKSITITENGSTSVIPDTGKTLSKVNITTNVPQGSNVTKGLVFSEYDTDGYPHKAEFVGMTSIPNAYCSYLFYIDDGGEFGKKITSIAIPNSVTSIGEYAFSRCSSLTSIKIPNSVTSIGIGAFSYCSRLTNIVIPNNVKIIQEGTFYFCQKLTILTIPENVSNIGGMALAIGSTTNKATITMKGLFPPTIQSDTFNASYLNKIYVPKDSLIEYKNATNWANFADYIDANPNK